MSSIEPAGYDPLTQDLEVPQTQTYTALPKTDEPKPNASLALKVNTYDALVLAVTKLDDAATVITKGKAQLWISFIIAFVLHAVAVFLQVLLIFMLLQFTIARREDKLQVDLVDYTHLLTNALAKGEALNNVTHGHVLGLCAADHNVPYTQSVMIMLWGIKLLPSISSVLWILLVLWRLPLPSANHSVLEIEEGRDSITHLSAGLKLFTVLLVGLPRFTVTIYLYWMGAKFLMYAPSLGVLIMKSVGLAFIVTVPDLLASGILSEAFHKELGRSHFKFPSAPNDKWNLWGASVTKVVIVLSATIFYCRVLCADLQYFREACTTYEYHFLLPQCEPNCGSHMLGFTFYN